MATTQQYSLRWNNYFRHLTYALDNHRTNDDFVDVSLCCDGRKIKAHKVVLSSCSSYFKEIFKENPHPHPVIIFKFIKFEDLNSIVEFMYQGEVNVQQEALQSFLQTAELLAVQGLTSEEKEKQKTVVPAFDEQKLIRAIPSTIRAISEQSQNTQSSQTLDLLPSSQTLSNTAQQQQQQQQQQQSSVLGQVQQQPHHLANTQQLQQLQVQQEVTRVAPISLQTHHLQTQQQLSSSVANASTTTAVLSTSSKKRKITFSDVEDNIYTTETVDYGVVKEDPSMKSDMTFLRGTVKMDMPEYIVSEVDDNEQLSDGGTQQNSQDGNAQNVTQYNSEYEILTDPEIEEKYQQADADNAEIAIEMGRLLNTTVTTAVRATLEDGVVTKADKSGGTSGSDLASNKWTECQFCKMVITTVNLWRHIRTQHTPQPPRKCELCNKNFKNKYSLREHIRISHEQKLTGKLEN